MKTMFIHRTWRVVSILLALPLLLLGLVGATTQPAAADPFASGAFQRIWERSDKPIQQGVATRTWLWGDQPFKALQEKYVQGATGTRLVQYFDKSRMEINNPNGDPNSPWFVTNGLLVVELMSGAFQIGDNEYEQSTPANVAVAGDSGDANQTAPTYATMASVASLHAGGNTANAQAPGSPVLATLDRNGKVGALQAFTSPATYSVYVAETRHNIPDVFWNFLNSSGLTYQNGAYINDNLMSWVYVMGYPITEPYWTNIRVAGVERQVLVQAFQRRVLTYSPNNPEGWKVEMGNVGRHYYSWRYERPACPSVPVRGFGTVYTSTPDVARALGCPLSYQTEQVTTTALQSFQHGTMLWVSAYDYHAATIFVFFDDGTYQQFDDRFVEGTALPCDPGPVPPGYLAPKRGFGKVWCEGTGARVRERLGLATAPEKGATGAWQQFDHGFMFWTGATDQIFVLMDNGDSHRYQVFHDTFNG